MNHLLEKNLPKKYVSTKESAVLLNVSLGTVQKMVESGELLAWKTRGGHRRILVSSLEAMLKERNQLFHNFVNKKFQLLGFHRNFNDCQNLSSILSRLTIPLEIHSSLNYHQCLMSAVEIKPHIIFIDSRLPSIEKIVLIYFLSQNAQTHDIPVLVNKKFLRLNQESISLTGEGSEFLLPYLFKNQQIDLTPDCIFNHPNLKEYEDDYYESHPDLNYSYFEEIMSPLFPTENNY